MAKIFEGEAGVDETNRFQDWYQQNKENKQLCDMLKKNWDALANNEQKIEVDEDRAWMTLRNRLEREQLIPRQSERPAIRSLSLLRVAAAAALLVGLGIFSYLMFSPSEKMVRMTVRTVDQQVFGLNLPDGSQVDLNAGSSLKYKLQRSGIRMVSLEGEAFFDVSLDEYSPFIIRAGNATVRVTGTSFSVRIVSGSKRVEVYVESGNVQLYPARQENHMLILGAGQMGVLEQNRLSMNTDIEPNHLSWKTRKLVFRETRLGDVAGVLNRTYSRKVLFTSESLEDCLFTGTFDAQPIDSVVRVIRLAFDLDVERDGRAYVLSGDGCH